MQKSKKLSIDGLPAEWLFPTTRYRGSKRKILPWIWDGIRDLSFNSVLDLFGGTSVVSLLFKRMGKRVTYNDYLKYNQLTGIAFIRNNTTKITDEDLIYIFTQHKHITYDSFISDNFNGIYFLDNENQWLDMVIANINSLKQFYFDDVLAEKQAIFMWALGQACLMKRPFNLFHRKNLNLRTTSVKRKFGNKTSWENSFPDLMKRFVYEANQIVFENGKRNEVLKLDAFNVKQKGYDLIYIDPPYFIKGLRDNNYYKLYHFLEGMVNYKKWKENIDWQSRNLCLKDDSNSWPKIITRDTLIEIYKALIYEYRESYIVISHKSGSIVSTECIEQLMIEQGKSVIKKMKPYKYALNKKNGTPGENIEWLIIGS